MASITRVAETLSLSTIAGFVENPATIDWPRAHGANFAQGHAVGRPEPIESFLSAGSKLSRQPGSSATEALSVVDAMIGFQPR